MKYLLFCLLLLSSLCKAQDFKNYTKVTVCRLVNFDAIGPCSIQYYAKKLKRTGHYIQAMESHNDTLAYNLLKLKADAKTWESRNCSCGQEPAPNKKPLVTAMFIVEVNSFKDTIFTTVNHNTLFSPKEQLEYIAPENHTPLVLPKEVNDFFRRDFASEIEAWKVDFIASGDITFLKKPFYGLTRKEFEAKVAYFDMATTDSVYLQGKFLKADKTYRINDMEFNFDSKEHKLSRVYISNSRNNSRTTYTVVIDGVKIGDSEEVLCNKYDNSTLLKHWDAPLVAINNYYTYEVMLNNEQGVVRYAIRNGYIYEIAVEFSYAEKKKK